MGCCVVLSSVHTLVVHEAQSVISLVTEEVSVGINKRRLDKSQYVGRSDVLARIARCPSVVAEVIGVAHISHVQSCCEAVEEIDVGVEADVQTIEIILLCCSFALAVTQREVVHCYLITTLHVHAVVLRKGSLIEWFLPVGLVVIESVEEAVLVFIEEGNRQV